MTKYGSDDASKLAVDLFEENFNLLDVSKPLSADGEAAINFLNNEIVLGDNLNRDPSDVDRYKM